NRSTFGFPYRLVAQSIMKVWGNWLFEPYPFWGFTSGNGLMGGFDRNTLVALPNDRYQATAGDGTGTFTTGPKLRPFSEIELYLMGLAPAEEVPPILVAEGAQWVDGEHGLFTADAITEYTIADIIAEHGPRSPAFGEAPNSFRILTVIITEESLTRATLDGLDRGLAIIGDQGNSDIKANPWEYSFHTLTGGRGTVRTDGIFDALK